MVKARLGGAAPEASQAKFAHAHAHAHLHMRMCSFQKRLCRASARPSCVSRVILFSIFRARDQKRWFFHSLVVQMEEEEEEGEGWERG